MSRAFTPGASVSHETRKRVLEAAAALGYRPNALARSLISGRSRLIGIVLASLDNQFFPVVLEKLSGALAREGYHSLIFLANGSGAADAEVVDELIDYQVDGIVVGSTPLSGRCAERCERAGIPVVLFDRHQEEAGLTSVMFNNRAGAAAAAECLLASGARRIAHYMARQVNTAGRDRAEGFVDRMARAGGVPAAMVDTGGRPEAATEATRRLFADAATRPDGVFCGNDAMAFATINTLRYELGLRVPEDVAVVGFDDVPIAAWPNFALTTVRQDADMLVRAVVESLLGRIGRREVPPVTVLDCALVVRRSTRPVG